MTTPPKGEASMYMKFIGKSGNKTFPKDHYFNNINKGINLIIDIPIYLYMIDNLTEVNPQIY